MSYYVRGTNGSDITKVGRDGMFLPNNAGDEPNAALTELDNYTQSAKAWTDVGGVDVAITQATSAADADVLIVGYWNEGHIDRHCGGSIACIDVKGTYPHLSGVRFLKLEERPHWGHETTRERGLAIIRNGWMTCIAANICPRS